MNEILRVYMSREELDYRGTILPREYAVQNQHGMVVERSEDLAEIRAYVDARKTADPKIGVIDFTQPQSKN